MEIKPNISAGVSSPGIKDAPSTRKAADAEANSRANLATGQPGRQEDRVQLSSAGANEIARTQRIEALEQAVSDGTYDPPVKEVAHRIIENAVVDSEGS